ncbi:3-methyl-2-oxobutanoate hydroxymethyltransferase [Kribbella steppae]|uniref:3-methyl-2-oxobutanoate hydroxymethyltransferase n=1 Tax=Kribbella steppae TaxID=2512223 RepID=A0A4R2HZF1_9ACTN|nr:3-methyl-2-oxobutanoate hydroxymethyltransferase [Kribbella steppae]
MGDTPTITAYLPEMLEGNYGQESGGQSDNGYPSDPSAEYESDAPVSEQPKRVGARRRADVQQDAPSQVANENTGSHRARRAQAAGGEAEAEAGNPPAPTNAGGSPAPTTPAPSTPGGAPAPASAQVSSPVTAQVGGPADAQASAGSPAQGSSAAGLGEGSKRPRRYRIHHLRDMKNRSEKWAMLTAYDQYTAEIFDQAGIPVLLVGDSAANNVFGYETTLRVTVDELIPLARAVAGAVDRALVVADLPFGSYQASPEQAFHTAVRFMKEAGVHAVKLEGGRTVVPMVEKLTQSGIPVMAHIGFTPQSEHSIGGYRVQGRGDQAAGLIDDAIALAEAGAFSVVLEMVPGDVAAEITKRVTIPTIGIGAGRDTDAQVLVWQDMAGMRSGTMPRFVKRYADLRGILTSAATTYAAEVASGAFPTDEHTF